MHLLTIIFSKDRATQLDLLLNSIQSCDSNDVFSEIEVLYTYSNQQFADGYTELMNTYPDVWWNKEQRFKDDILDIIEQAKPTHVMFLVDDMIMMRDLPFDIHKGFDLLARQPVATISLRLGKNTTWQYQIDGPTVMPTMFREDNGLMIWNRTTIPSTMNFNYPFSVDSHIFRSDLIVPIIEKTKFTFPNDFESGLQTSVYQAPPLMACPKQSVFVNAPINRVQDIYPNRAGSIHSWSSAVLNSQYLDGGRIDYEAIDFSLVRGCHNELLLPFTNPTDE